MKVTYGWQMEKRLKLAHLGCGGHSYRNIFPCYPHCPVDLAAVVDLDETRAQVCARNWGAGAAYTDFARMLDEVRPDAVCIVTNYDEQGRPRYPQLAEQAMQAGCHVWIEKPPAASSDQIRSMQRVSRDTGRFTMVGFKKMFFPSLEKVKAIMSDPGFGRPTSIVGRYPQSLPPPDERVGPSMIGFLDHIVHPMSIMLYLGGRLDAINYLRSPINGAVVVNLLFTSGLIGSLHLAAGQSGTSPLERLEVVGEGSNVVVNNNCHLTWYRRGDRGPDCYAGNTCFIGSDEHAPLYWEPEFSLGGTTNKSLNLLGYLPQMLTFCQCVLDNQPPEKAGLADALEIMKVFEAFRGPQFEMVVIPRE